MKQNAKTDRYLNNFDKILLLFMNLQMKIIVGNQIIKIKYALELVYLSDVQFVTRSVVVVKCFQKRLVK